MNLWDKFVDECNRPGFFDKPITMIILSLLIGIYATGQLWTNYQEQKWRDKFYKDHPPEELDVDDSTPHIWLGAKTSKNMEEIQ